MSDTLLTLFTAPKPFKDEHIIKIQTNALNSWKALGDQVEILLLGNDEGVEEKAKELGLRHIPDVECNEKGTPLISSMLDLSRKNSHSPFLCIINTDIILFPDLLTALKKVSIQFDCFLLLGQRWDMEVREELPAGQKEFLRFKNRVKVQGSLHPPMGSDYFLFPRDCYQSIPDFAIGRAGWDNWFIFKSRFEHWPVIDATHDIVIVHQSHDYRHLPGGQPHYRLPETKENVIRGGGEQTIFTMADAQFSLVDGGVRKEPLTWKKSMRELEIFPLTGLKSMVLGKLFFYLFRPKKAYQALKNWFSGNPG